MTFNRFHVCSALLETLIRVSEGEFMYYMFGNKKDYRDREFHNFNCPKVELFGRSRWDSCGLKKINYKKVINRIPEDSKSRFLFNLLKGEFK